MNQILCYKLRHFDLEILQKHLDSYGASEINNVISLEQILDQQVDQYHALFVFVDESLDAENLETIIKYFGRIPINLILKNKDFDILMLAYKYRVNAVFESILEEEQLINCLIRIDLLSHQKQETLPVSQIVGLFTGPVHIKTNIEFFNRISNYFHSFNQKCEVTLVEIFEGGQTFYGKEVPKQLVERMRKTKLARNYIGNSEEVDSYVFTPVYQGFSQVSWLAIKGNPKMVSNALNPLFYKFVETVMIYRQGKEKEDSLTVLASTDEVTGLFNQRKLSEDLEEAVTQHEQKNEKFSLMFIDVDHFKDVNDKWGHVVGSALLQDIGNLLIYILRDTDRVYRYGGDEFVVIMPHVEIDIVYDVASRVLKEIKQTEFTINTGETYHLSVSIGIAEYPTDAKSAVEIIRFADEMMYMSKKSGRGKVFHISEVEDAGSGRK